MKEHLRCRFITNMELKNKVALVTGSTRGIGKAIVELLCKNGAIVYINSFKSKEEGEKLQRELALRGFKAYYINANISSEVDVKRIFDIIKKEYGKLDILVNNAGFYSDKTDYETYELFHKTNGLGIYLCTVEAEKIMKKGKIINISSIYGIKPNPDFILASGVKAEVESYTKVFAKKFKGRIEVNSVAPGYVDTKLVRDNFSEELLTKLLRNTSQKRLVKPEEIADAVIFLIEHDSITGQTIVVDNGILIS